MFHTFLLTCFSQNDLPGIEADMLFKFADKNNDGVVTEVMSFSFLRFLLLTFFLSLPQDEYIAWRLDTTETAARKAALDEAMAPILRDIQTDVQAAVIKLITRLQRGY